MTKQYSLKQFICKNVFDTENGHEMFSLGFHQKAVSQNETIRATLIKSVFFSFRQ